MALIHHCGKKGAAICPSDLDCMFHMFDYFGVSFYLAFILLGFCVSHFNFRRGCLKKGKYFCFLSFDGLGFVYRQAGTIL